MMADFIQFSDEWGMTLLIRTDEIEAVREVEGNDGQCRAALFLKSGVTFAVKTKFVTVAERLKGN